MAKLLIPYISCNNYLYILHSLKFMSTPSNIRSIGSLDILFQNWLFWNPWNQSKVKITLYELALILIGNIKALLFMVSIKMFSQLRLIYLHEYFKMKQTGPNT